MPCDSSYMYPTPLETKSAEVRELLREVAGKSFNHKSPKEYYGNVATIDKDTERLCNWCKDNENHLHGLYGMSLELQIWWRDHQEEDARREKDVRIKAKQQRLKKQALTKLTLEERRALGK